MRRYHVWITCFFIVPLFLFGIISLADTDKTVSEMENRNLKTFPAFSVQALQSGSFFTEVEEYYSDTFPFRDFFMSANRAFRAALNFSGDTELIHTKMGTDLGQGENLLGEPAPMPEAPVPEQQNAAEEDIVHAKSIIIIDDFAMELYSEPKESNAAYAGSVNRLKVDVGENVTVYNMIAPTSVEFYSPPKYHEGRSSQKESIQSLYAQLEGVKPVDVYDALKFHTDEYLYFRTDHHWTARGAYRAYEAFAGVAGFDPVSLDQLQAGRLEGFVGSMYRFTQSEKLKQNPDAVEYFLPPIAYEAFAFSDASMQKGTPVSAVYEQVGAANKYLAFYGGDSAIIRTITENKNGRKILVTKESYANAFVPFLISHYEEIYIVDPRRVSMNLPRFLADHGIGEVLVLNYAFATSNPTFMKGFNAMIP